MAGMETFITFGIYLVFLIGIGVYFYYKTDSHESYVLGDRGVGYWVTALSAQASDMSGWLLLGLPGAVYLSIRTFSAIVILFFFTIYSASGLVASGKLFDSLLGIDYKWGVIIGGGTIIIYTFLGGYLAGVWTDFFQGALMFFAIIVVPIGAYFNAGGIDGISAAMDAREISLNIFRYAKVLSFPVIISGLGWGLGYFGQPHIIVRFMSIDSADELWKSRIVAMIWVIISLLGAIAVGVTGIGVFSNVSEMGGDAEKVFIFLIDKLFNPWLAGILYAAILSAIMSTISSQLLVSSNTLTEDFYRHIVKREKTNKEMIWLGRWCVMVIFVIASYLAMNPDSKVLEMVSYAWAGFGGVFSPVVLFTLYKKDLSWKSVLVSMVIATATVIIWKETGLGKTIYEIVPSFIVNCICIYLFEKFRVFKK